MAGVLFGKVLKILRSINNHTLNIRLFPIFHIFRSKIQVIIFSLYPSFLNFVTLKKNKFPSNDSKFSKTQSVLDDIILDSNNNFFDEVNIFMRGFGKDFSSIAHKKNIFLVNYSFLTDENNKNDKDYSSERKLFTPKLNCYHVGDGYETDECMAKNLPFILFQRTFKHDENYFFKKKDVERYLSYEKYIKTNSKSKIIKFYFNTNCTTIRSGSGLHVALILSKISKKVNIFGWDFYIDKNMKFDSIFKNYNNLAPIDKYLVSDNYFEYMLCNIVFVNRLLNLNHVHIEGRLKDFIIANPSIVKKATQIFYK
jgi:hypothetical protein